MFEYIKAITSKIGKDGDEYISVNVNPCSFDNEGISRGKTIVLTNNYKKNTYEINEFTNDVYGYPHHRHVKLLEKGKDEIKAGSEFKEWLINNGYSDEEFIEGMKKFHPDSYEKYYKH